MKLGLIGTGMMGTQLAIRLAKKGHEVIVEGRRTRTKTILSRIQIKVGLPQAPWVLDMS